MSSMDWIRRNWPDLLIGLALVAVIAGIIATLLNGGTFLPFGQNNTAQNGGSLPATSSATPEAGNSTVAVPGAADNSANNGSVIVVPPSIDGAAANPGASVADAVNGAGEAVSEAATGAAAATVDAVAGATDTATDTATDAVTDTAQAAVQPVLPGSEASGSVVAVPLDAAEDIAAATEAATEAAADSATVSAATASADAAATAADGAYRISVGAFSSSANAESRAATFRDANYPVFTAPQGDLTLVLVGPYDSNAQAQQVAGQITASGLEASPIIYELNTGAVSAPATPAEVADTLVPDTSATSASAAEAPVATGATDSSATDTATPVAAAAAPAGAVPPTATQGSYIQTGAYGSVESSMPQRRVLEALGFTVLHVEEQGLIKLLVGPYDDGNLATAQAQLNARNIDNIVRR